MELTGKIKKIEEVQQITEAFKKRNIWVETFDNPTYPQVLEIALTQKNVDLLDNTKSSKFKVGDEVKVHVNLRGRVTAGKDGKADRVFNSIEAWRFESVANGGSNEATATKESKPAAKKEEVPASDDLPF